MQKGGLFVFFMWHRVARFAFDKWQTATEKKHELYLFNGATFKSGQKDTFALLAVEHLRLVSERLMSVVSLHSRAEKLFERVAEEGEYVGRVMKSALE